mmetsp:Transcript_51640/g.85567  ORF Transcript_51640/g.85567 Transcript_51640/m.85567 type:complete len:86 (-) Transcript_51640:53-310(-)
MHMRQLFSFLKEKWPICASRHDEFNPHLTVAKLRVSDISAYKQQWQSTWKDITFKCDKIYLISRRGNDPFVIRNTINLSDPMTDW